MLEATDTGKRRGNVGGPASGDGGGAAPAAPIISAGLLARIAEAADGARTGANAWFVARYEYDDEFGYDVRGKFWTEAKADNWAADLTAKHGVQYGVFGPFVTEKDVPVPDAGNVTEIVLRWETPSGQKKELILPAKGCDAIFWSRSAMEKFLLPYYVALGGEREQKRLMKRITAAGTVASIHLPSTEYIGSTAGAPTPDDPDPPAVGSLPARATGTYVLIDRKADDNGSSLIPI
jgi:hypothetical protein